MKTKLIRIEQKEANNKEIDNIVNKEIANLEKEGHKIQDIKIAVGRDADANSGIEKRFSITFVLMYE